MEKSILDYSFTLSYTETICMSKRRVRHAKGTVAYLAEANKCRGLQTPRHLYYLFRKVIYSVKISVRRPRGFCRRRSGVSCFVPVNLTGAKRTSRFWIRRRNSAAVSSESFCASRSDSGTDLPGFPPGSSAHNFWLPFYPCSYNLRQRSGRQFRRPPLRSGAL